MQILNRHEDNRKRNLKRLKKINEIVIEKTKRKRAYDVDTTLTPVKERLCFSPKAKAADQDHSSSVLNGGLRQNIMEIYNRGLDKYYNCFLPLSTPISTSIRCKRTIDSTGKRLLKLLISMLKLTWIFLILELKKFIILPMPRKKKALLYSFGLKGPLRVSIPRSSIEIAIYIYRVMELMENSHLYHG
jgi:hypothetical protein